MSRDSTRHLTSTTCGPTLAEILLAALLTVLLILALAHPAGGQSPPVGEPGADYLFPSEVLTSRADAVRVPPGLAFGQGERVAYTAFDGKVHELTRFRGRHVAILLPDSWMGPTALSSAQIRSFVDRSDLIYQSFMDWIGVQPAGEGLMPVAILPDGETCGWGCGLIGGKGVEIADVGRLNPILWREIAAGKGVSVLIHEMTHNFDVFWAYLHYLPSKPTAIRFWVSGLGIVGSVPYAPGVSYAWTPPAGLDLTGLTYRSQPLRWGVPLYDFTLAQAFAP